MGVQVKAGGAWSAELGYAHVFRKQSDAYVVGEEMLQKVSGVWQQVWRKDGPPPNPTSVLATSANGGINTVQWDWPANAEADYSLARVEVSVNAAAWTSMATTAHPTAFQTRTGAVNGTSYKYRIRLRDLGGNMSSWVETGTITGKNLAPSIPVVAVSPADWAAGQFNVNVYGIASTYSDVSNVSLYRRPAGGGGWTLVYSAGYSAPSVTPVIAQINHDTYHEFYATVTSPGGTSSSSVVSVWSRPSTGTTKSVLASNSHTYSISNGVWRTDSYSVRQGRFGSTHGLQQGGWFYGTNLQDICRGHVPASAKIFIVRSGSSGTSGSLGLNSHGYEFKPASGGLALISSWTSTNSFTGTDASAWEAIPGGLLSSITSGVVKGFGLYTASTSSSQYRSMRGPDTNGFAGAVDLTF